MSASTQVAPRQISFGRFPTALAALALVVILAVAVAIVALNGTKAAAPATSSGFGHGPGDWYYTAPAVAAPGAPPVVIDHGWSNGETFIRPTATQYGYGGPRLGDTAPRVGDSTAAAEKARHTGGRNPGLRPQ
jgi:hypothetical protein